MISNQAISKHERKRDLKAMKRKIFNKKIIREFSLYLTSVIVN